MFHRVIQVSVKPDFVLELTFEDHTQGEVCLKDRLFGPVFEPLRDPEIFAQVEIDHFGAICWPNGADLDPSVLYEHVVSGKLN